MKHKLHETIKRVAPLKVDRVELVARRKNKGVAALFVSDDERVMFPLNTGYEIFYCNQILKMLDTGLEIEFKSYHQYMKLLEAVSDVLEKRNNEIYPRERGG
jgi:hypothetical protein